MIQSQIQSMQSSMIQSRLSTQKDAKSTKVYCKVRKKEKFSLRGQLSDRFPNVGSALRL